MLGHEVLQERSQGHQSRQKAQVVKNQLGSIAPGWEVRRHGRRRGKGRRRQQVDNRSVLEKMHVSSRYTSLTHTSEEFGRDPREFGASRVGSLLSDNRCLLLITSSRLIPE